MIFFIVSDQSDDEDCKQVPGSYDHWDVDQQMDYIQNQILLCENLAANNDDDEVISVARYVTMCTCTVHIQACKQVYVTAFVGVY